MLRYETGPQQEALFDAGDSKRQQEALDWARERQARYALTGAVDEWRYKVGVDGEPAAGVTLQIIDVGFRRHSVERHGRQERLEPRSPLGRGTEADPRPVAVGPVGAR